MRLLPCSFSMGNNYGAVTFNFSLWRSKNTGWVTQVCGIVLSMYFFTYAMNDLFYESVKGAVI